MRCSTSILGALLAWVTITAGCATGHSSPKTASPEAWNLWQQRRVESIAGTNGWATLVGLLWIPEGRSSLGSEDTATLKLPTGRAPEVVGEIERTGSLVRYRASTGDAPPIRISPESPTDEPIVLTIGELRMFVIVRGERLALRVKDSQAPTRIHFRGLKYFPYSTSWKIAAILEPPTPDQTVTITDVTGTSTQQPSAGVARFTLDGQPQTLEAVEDDESHDLWFIFRDGTSGSTTYGGGRFLHAAKPGPDGGVTLDFNFAYNPPCAFTPFATCPVPPRQNWIKVSIPAGEKRYAEH